MHSFWLTTMQLFMSLAEILFFGMITVPEGVGVMWIMNLGIGGLMVHFCITNALSIAPAVVVIPLDFMRLPLISMIGLLAYGEVI